MTVREPHHRDGRYAGRPSLPPPPSTWPLAIHQSQPTRAGCAWREGCFSFQLLTHSRRNSGSFSSAVRKGPPETTGVGPRTPPAGPRRVAGVIAASAVKSERLRPPGSRTAQGEFPCLVLLTGTHSWTRGSLRTSSRARDGGGGAGPYLNCSLAPGIEVLEIYGGRSVPGNPGEGRLRRARSRLSAAAAR